MMLATGPGEDQITLSSQNPNPKSPNLLFIYIVAGLKELKHPKPFLLLDPIQTLTLNSQREKTRKKLPPPPKHTITLS